MKQLLGLMVVACGLWACGTTKSQEQKAVEALHIARQVSDSIDNRRFTITLNHVVPHRLPSRMLTSHYTIHVEGDTIVSYLPYFGRAYRSDAYGRDRSPLDFSSSIVGYDVQKTRKRGTRIKLNTKRNMERMTYHIEVFDNGRATLNVVSSDRDPIAFSGDMNLGE